MNLHLLFRHSLLLPALLLCALPAVRAADSAPAPIPFSELGAKATADYKGEAIGIEATAEGARLRTGFQKLAGTVTREGLWLESTEAEGGRLRIIATAIGRADDDLCHSSSGIRHSLASTGTVAVGEKTVSFLRPGLTEEYSVSVDGVRRLRRGGASGGCGWAAGGAGAQRRAGRGRGGRGEADVRGLRARTGLWPGCAWWTPRAKNSPPRLRCSPRTASPCAWTTPPPPIPCASTRPSAMPTG